MKDTLFKMAGLAAAFLLIAGAIVYLDSMKPGKKFSGVSDLSKNHAPDLQVSGGFINVAPFSLLEHFGKKVILVDFWTYSCINCQRTIPYLNAWHEKYKDKGLLIVGVHTPEFEFEKKYENVEAAVKKFGIKYPVVQDNDYATWNAYQNRYWPHKYLIGIGGQVVYDHIGEGGYEETERKIQEALGEQMAIEKPVGVQEVDFEKVKSPETYFGALRNKNFGSGKPLTKGVFNFSASKVLNSDILYLGGMWAIEDEYAENKKTGAKISFRYDAKDVYLVANSLDGVTIKILRDGKLVKEAAGADVEKDASGEAVIREERLYRLIEGESYGKHLLEIIIESPGLRAFAFTFG
ncbi:MAG: redoxin domain-containing protein [Candidatus Sungbacteria bacterium]|nr:redoxin domain-containing protein [Candidatus Sungbacteria bacterium]